MNTQRTERIQALKEKMLAAPRFVSIEQARIITRVYQENEGLSQARKRALSLKAALEEMKIAVDPQELIIGNRTSGVRAGVVFPESGDAWVERELEDLPTRPQDPFQVRPEDIREFREKIYPYWQGRTMEDAIQSRCGKEIAAISRVVKINQTDHAQGHICPDVSLWLEKGPAGLLAEARQRRSQEDPQQQEFYDCMILTLEGACRFLERCAEAAEKTAEMASAADQKTLKQAADNCRSLAVRPAMSYWEAVQSVWTLFVILHMESNASSFSPGRMDRYLEPYYEKDVQSGALNPEEALEILECLWLKFNQIVYLRNRSSAKYFAGFPIGFNIVVGGQDEAGRPVYNTMTKLCLQAQYDLGLPQPNLSVRLFSGTPHALMQDAIRVLALGSGMPQFFNDEAVVHALREDLGMAPADALDYAVVGCVELCTPGRELGWSDAAMFNLCKALELALNHGVDLITKQQTGPDYGGLDTYGTYAQLEDSFRRMVDWYIGRMMAVENQVEQAHQQYLPTAFLSAVIHDCMENGRDVVCGGAHYNFSGIQMIQVADLADSLAAVKELVYDTGMISRAELMASLETDFEGHEVTRQMLLHKAPKYGNDVEWVDALGARWAQYFRRRMKDYTNYRGGICHTGMYTVSAHVPMGENVGASPDGRKAGKPLADGGMSPAYGRDESGPTAVLKSVSRLGDSLTTNGGLLNMKFLPSFFETEEGRQKFELFLRAFVDLHIPHIQFNVVRREDLLDAKAHPENHRSLTVRVAGYTAYFVELAGKLQDEIIARTSYDRI